MSEEDAERLIGTVLAGRYEVTGVLGAGGMGVVLEARQLAVDRKVAVKLLHPRFATNRHAVARFMREMQITSRLEHPSTIRVYDFGEADLGETALFLVMELVQGRTLNAALSGQKRMDPARVVRIALQIARALDAAHSEGIVHRDLKPDNVMLVDRYGDQDVVKVLDFGIARFLEGVERQEIAKLTADGALVGTPAYMSPEQATGAPIVFASDLYSFGVMLFEMATGTVPFSAPTTVSLIVKHVHEAPPRPSERAELPEGLESLILSCLEKDPARRPKSARLVAEALEEIGQRLDALGPVLADPRGLSPERAVEAKSHTLAAETARGPGSAAPRGHDRHAGADCVEVPREAPSRLGWILAGVGAVAAAGVAVALAVSGGAGANPEPVPASPLDLPEVESSGPEADTAGVAATAEAEAVSPRSPADEPAAPGPECASLVADARTALNGGQEVGAHALDAVRAAVARCPRWAVAHVVDGQARQRMKDLDAARRAFERAQELAPGWGVPRFDRALVELASGRPARAEAILTELLAIAPRWPDAHLLRAQAELGRREYAAARRDAEIATELSPDRAEAWYLLGESHRALGPEGSREAGRRAYCKAQSLGMAAAAPRCEGGW